MVCKRSFVHKVVTAYKNISVKDMRGSISFSKLHISE